MTIAWQVGRVCCHNVMLLTLKTPEWSRGRCDSQGQLLHIVHKAAAVP